MNIFKKIQYPVDITDCVCAYSQRRLAGKKVKMYKVRRESDGATMDVTSETTSSEIVEFSQGNDVELVGFYNQATRDGEPFVDANLRRLEDTK